VGLPKEHHGKYSTRFNPIPRFDQSTGLGLALLKKWSILMAKFDRAKQGKALHFLKLNK
jgi:hypothetical protein